MTNFVIFLWFLLVRYIEYCMSMSFSGFVGSCTVYFQDCQGERFRFKNITFLWLFFLRTVRPPGLHQPRLCRQRMWGIKIIALQVGGVRNTQVDVYKFRKSVR